MSGIVALVALAVALVAFVVVFSIGFSAVTRYPDENDPARSAPRYILSALVASIVATVSAAVFAVAGIAWIIERFTI